MRRWLVQVPLALMWAFILWGCGADDPTRENDITPLTGLEVSAQNPAAIGTSVSFSATGDFSGVYTRSVTDQTTWSSSDLSILAFDAARPGLASTLSPGTVRVSAAMDGVTATFDFTVSDAVLTALAITPQDPAVPAGLEQQFAATGIFSDGTEQPLTRDVAWESSVPTVATILSGSDRPGLATTLAVGQTTISAVFGSQTAQTVLTATAARLASLEVTPAAPSLASGLTQQFTAQGHFTDDSSTDLTTQVLWESSAPSVATVSNDAGSEGLATSQAIGNAVISASFDGVRGTTTLSVTEAALVSIDITPNNSVLALGGTAQFSATAKYSDGTTKDVTQEVVWSSTRTDLLSVSNDAASRGLAEGLQPGHGALEATLNGITGAETVIVF